MLKYLIKLFVVGLNSNVRPKQIYLSKNVTRFEFFVYIIFPFLVKYYRLINVFNKDFFLQIRIVIFYKYFLHIDFFFNNNLY